MRNLFADGGRGFVTDELATFGQGTEDEVETGDEDDAEGGAEEHAAEGRAADRAIADGAGARRHDERQQARDERERGHENRPEADPGAFDGRLEHRQAFIVPLHRELHDQDRVLSEQADEHDDADLRVDVVRQAHQLQQEERAEEARG